MASVMRFVFILKSFYSLQYRSNEYIEVLPDARQVNVSLFPDIDEKIRSINFTAQMNFDVSGINMSNKWDNDHGGAFQFHNHGWRNPNIVLFNNTFNNCSSKIRGGTIFIFEGEKMTISQCSIFNSNATHGGSVYLQYSKTAQILNSTFSNSVAYTQQGGAGYIYNITDFVEVFDSQIENSWANQAGGALYFLECGKITLKNVSTMNSTSNNNYGGSQHYKTITNLIIDNLNVSNSLSKLQGGGLYVESVTKAIISNSSFNNCTSSTQNGGVGFFTASTNISIEDSQFNNGYAFENGGAIYGQSISNFDMKRTWFEKFAAKKGGGVYLTSVAGTTLFNNCIFKDIYSTNTGGAVCLESINLAIFDEVTFVNCSSTNNGGAIYISTIQNMQVSKLCGVSCGKSQGSSTLGSFMHITFTSSPSFYMIMNSTTISNCVSTASSQQGTLYMTLQNFDYTAINISHNVAAQFSSLYVSHAYSGRTLYSTIFNNTNTGTQYVYYQYCTSSSSYQMMFSHFIGNKGPSTSSVVIYHYASQGVLYLVCIFQQNMGQLFAGANSAMVKSSYVYHINSLGNYYNFDDVKTGSVNTQTFTLQHLSTMYCQALDPIAPLDVPCQTLPQACETNFIVFPSPTECPMVTDSNLTPLITLSKVFHAVQMALYLVVSAI